MVKPFFSEKACILASFSNKVKVVDKMMQSNYVLFYMLRAPVCKNQTNSKFRGKGGKFDFFQFLMLDKLGSK